MKIIVVKPHDKEPDLKEYQLVYKIFLAGTIDNGNSYDWQSEYIENMYSISKEVNHTRKDDNEFIPDANVIVIYNPRRDSVKGFSPENTSEMNYQVNWELDHLEDCDRIYMNFEPKSKSPISLLELGLFAKTDKLVVVCPKEYYRYDNVYITCKRYSIPFKHNINDRFVPCVK